MKRLLSLESAKTIQLTAENENQIINLAKQGTNNDLLLELIDNNNYLLEVEFGTDKLKIIQIAEEYNNFTLLNTLMEKYPNQLNLHNADGLTPLHYAVEDRGIGDTKIADSY